MAKIVAQVRKRLGFLVGAGALAGMAKEDEVALSILRSPREPNPFNCR
jgi:hypothetical protein